MTDFNKILNVLKELPYEKLIDVHNKVLGTVGIEALGTEEQGRIYKVDDKTIDKVFKNWKPSEIIHYIDDKAIDRALKDWKPSEIVHYFDDRHFLNAKYLVHDDAYGWQTLADARDAVVKCVDIYNLAVTIKNRYVRCEVPEIDKIITNKLAKAETTEETE